MTLGEVATLTKVLDAIKGWLAEVIGARGSAKEQRAANMLGTAGSLLAALRTLDNAFRDIMTDIWFIEAGWEPDQRQAMARRLLDLANQEKILPIVRQSRNDLNPFEKGEGLPPNAVGPLKTLVKCADCLIGALGGDVTPYPSKQILNRVVEGVLHSRDPEEVQELREEVQGYLAALDRSILSEADIAFGKLKAAVLMAYPKIPAPGWAVSL